MLLPFNPNNILEKKKKQTGGGGRLRMMDHAQPFNFFFLSLHETKSASGGKKVNPEMMDPLKIIVSLILFYIYRSALL